MSSFAAFIMTMTALANPAYSSDELRAMSLEHNPYRCQWCTEFDTELIQVAAENCRNLGKRTVDVLFLETLLYIEIQAGIPEDFRGAVLAAACHESGFNPVPRNGDGGKAVGLLQLWPWWERKYEVNRRCPFESAIAWASRIVMLVPKAKRKGCKRRPFLAAWAWVGSGPKGYTCRAPRHWTLLKRWHRKVTKRLASYGEETTSKAALTGRLD